MLKECIFESRVFEPIDEKVKSVCVLHLAKSERDLIGWVGKEPLTLPPVIPVVSLVIRTDKNFIEYQLNVR